MKLRGLFVFLVLAYALPIGVMAAAGATDWVTYASRGDRGIWLLRVLYLWPGIAALIALRIDRDPDAPRYGLLPIPWLRVLLAVLAVGAITVISVTVQILSGRANPDWELTPIVDELEAQGMTLTGSPIALLVVGFVLTLIIGAVFYAPLCLPGEFAWRGFLIPRLMKLGRVRAYILAGLLWGAWFVPVAISEAVGSLQPWSSLTRVLAMAIVLTFILAEVLRRTGSLVLCAAITGSFAAQLNGMHVFLFLKSAPPWTGSFGYPSIGVWLVAALVLWYWPERAAGSKSAVRK